MKIEVEALNVRPVVGDRDELGQVFQNLMDNAIKYGRSDSTVRVVARQSELANRRLGRPAVAVSVIDRGEGIAREHLPRLTERFYRVDTARSRELGGTGLGLAIVKHIREPAPWPARRRQRGGRRIDLYRRAPGREPIGPEIARLRGMTPENIHRAGHKTVTSL